MVIVLGHGLHTGEPVRVALERTHRAVSLHADGAHALIGELAVASTDRATTVEACDGRLRIGTVEHAFAALAALGVYEGLAIHVDGPEMPLLNGGALDWCRALDALELTPVPAAPMRITRPAVMRVGASTYAFSPGDAIDIGVRIDFGDARLAPEAAWKGEPHDFVDRIAPARTFAFERDLRDFAERGLARHVAPEAVIVVGRDAILCAGAPFAADEPARHKLLDLLGDLYVHGGVPLGSIRADRPGHAANASAFAWARAEGVLARA
jgi:UDP-3-O-[3-hydroxymyristoyl] N-acetylglucosamine deacetylase